MKKYENYYEPTAERAEALQMCDDDIIIASCGTCRNINRDICANCIVHPDNRTIPDDNGDFLYI